MNLNNQFYFAPQLYIKSGVTDISFYSKAFNAVLLRQWTNDDGSIHVAELSIEGAIFHLHEEKVQSGSINPGACNGTTSITVPNSGHTYRIVISAVTSSGTVSAAPFDVIMP